MEALRKWWVSIKPKKKYKPVVINISSPVTKSCGNCDHYKREPGFDKCMHYPAADINEVNVKVCKPDERKLWSEKKYGLISRFFIWLF